MDGLKNFDITIINYWVLIPAASIILFLSFLEKRNSRSDLCNGRPALLIPFHFLDGYDNRTAYAMAFGTATSTVMSLILSVHTLEFELPLWARALYVYLDAIIGCLTCFPLFACLTTPYKAAGAILSILYSLLWLALNLVKVLAEYNKIADQKNTDTGFLNAYKAGIILIGLPVLFSYVMLTMQCFYTLYNCFSAKLFFKMSTESTITQHQEEHVKWVFRKYRILDSAHACNTSSSKTFIDKMKDSKKLRYFTSFPFFKYPVRIFVLSFLQLNILYWAVIVLLLLTVYLLQFITDVWEEFLITMKALQNDIIIILIVCFSFALFVCVINALTQISVAARNYRYDMLRIYQGKRKFARVSPTTPQNILTRNMTFPGYQMAFMLWGFVLCFTTVLLLTLVPVMLIYAAAKLDKLGDLASNISQLVSFPAIAIVVFYLLVFMSKRVLLQKKVQITDQNPPLNVDNRKFYEIVNYYSLFTNMAVGLLTCLFRIFESIFFGIFSVGRLDRSVFPHELESWDRGYTAYISMLLVDNAHNNPCMRVFAHLLWTKTLAARLRPVEAQEMQSDVVRLVIKSRFTMYGSDIPLSESTINSNHSDKIKALVESNEFRVSKQAQKRWHLAFTLINNPQLCKFRKQALTLTEA